MIEIKSITKKYGDYTAIENINLTVNNSSVLGLAGFNGSGKTTLLNVCAGVFKADSGAVYLDGEDAYNNDSNRISLFYVSDNAWFPAGSTIKSAAKFYANYFPSLDFSVLEKVCDIFGIKVSAPVRSLSKGMTKQAILAIAFAAKPKYLLIDETFDGLDPHKKEILRKLLLEYMNETEASVIISSHDLSEISGVCDSIAIINGKNVVLNCAIEDISEHFRKVKLMFTQPVTESKFSGINHRNLKLSGRMATLLVYGNPEEEIEKLEKLNPETIETELLTLEEVFSIETEAVTDYDKIKTIFK